LDDWRREYMRFTIFILIMIGIAPMAFGLDVSIESKTIRQGEEFTLQVSLQNASELGHTIFDLVYPPDALDLLDATPQEVALAVDQQNAEHKAIYVTNPEHFPASGMDRLRFAWVFGMGYNGDGDVLTLRFKMGSAEMGEIPIQVESAGAVRAAETLDEQPVQTHDGLLTVKLYGDVTDNGQISSYDAAKILRYIVGLEDLSGEALLLADVNGINGVTTYDAALILMKLVDKIIIFPVLDEGAAAPPALLTARKLSVGATQIKNKTVKVPLELDVADDVVSGDITIGFDPIALKFAKAIETNLTEGYALLTKDENDEVRICFAGDTPMEGGGALLELEFEVLDETADGSRFEIRKAILNEGVKLDLRDGAVEFIPTKTALLPNYPNPFNPETWIPYQLAKDADVSVRIYDIAGKLVKELKIGCQRKGYYTSKSRAAHWDGRNTPGERVASGIYFYQMRIGKKSFVRKLAILK